MGSEVAPDFTFDQVMYYPPAANYYGYYCTGIKSPGEWDDHWSFLGLDGQDPHYSGLYTENVPYVYYAPSYGYAESDYNPYNPFIPGAVIGVDSPFIGTQQYFASPTYRQPVSSTPYVPINYQSSSDIVPNGISEPLLANPVATVASKSDIEGTQFAHPQASASKAAYIQRVALGKSSSEASSPATLSEGSLNNKPSSEQCPSHGSVLPSNLHHVMQFQGRNSSGSVQAADNFLHGRVPSDQIPLKVDMSGNNALNSFGSNVHKWATVDKFMPRFQSNNLFNGSGSPYMLHEQNQGTRTNKAGGRWASITVKSYTTRVDVGDLQGNIIINANQYNRDDFPVEYPDAKFFVIKSYSEDDVHRSIKYNVWSSTATGNRRLDIAYKDAQGLSAGKPKSCPVFLFFSVNASGHFCGVAEMTSPVDFQKDMDFWQQDKWTGSFPVKWHIVKDVPNSSFRHIILENNENKPVTHSRDTQEITYIQGINMLKIFKTSTLKRSILDDFIHYDERESVTQVEKSRLLRKTYNSSLFIPTFVPKNIRNGSVNLPPPALDIQQGDDVARFKKVDEKSVDNEIPRNNEMHRNCTVSQPLNVDGKQPVGIVRQHLKADGQDDKQPTNAVYRARKVAGKPPKVIADKLPELNGRELLDVADQHLEAHEKQENYTAGSQRADGGQIGCTVIQHLKADQKQPNGTVDWPSRGDGKQLNYSVHPPKANGKQLNGTAVKPSKADGKQTNGTVPQTPKAAGKQFNGVVHHSRSIVGGPSKPHGSKTVVNMALTSEQAFPNLGATRQSDGKEEVKPKPVVNPSDASPIRNIGSLSINSNTSEADCSNAVADVVTVGSVHINVKDVGEPSSEVLTFGTVPVDPQ